jgi:hypothetical protein
MMLEKLKSEFVCVFADVQTYKTNLKIGALAGQVFVAAPVFAQGFINGFRNLDTLAQSGIALLILVGALGGLGFILGGLFSMYKKYDRGNDDVTWGKIGLQIAAGGLAMALSWVGVQVVETLGGSQGDIGRGMP